MDDSKSNLWSWTNLLSVMVFLSGLLTYLANDAELIKAYPMVPSYLLMVAGVLGGIIRQFTRVAVRGFALFKD